MAVPMGEITRALVGVRRRLCVKWGFVDMDVYEQEYRFCFFARCPYEKTDTTFRSIPLTTESFPQKEGGEAVWVLIIFTVSNPIYSHSNMLKITSDGRKLGLDQRLMNPLLPDDPDSKLNACVGNILHIWQDGQADKLTQLVFCDLSTPKNDGTFNVYDDVKTKLIANGVPAEEVAFICSALRIERLCWNKKRPASAGLNYIESLSLKKPLKFLIMLVEKSILKWYIKQTKMVSKDISASAREWIGFPIISYHEKLHRGICLHLQRPPKIESLANFEPIGRCKIPMKMLMKRNTR